VTEEDIRSLVIGGFMAPKELSGYRCTVGQDVPAPNFSEICSLHRLLPSRIQCSIHWFVRDLLRYHDVQVRHLTPNGIMLLAMFISFCEDFAGIELH
jgi:hypothetical protein